MIVLQGKGLTKSYGVTTVFKDISFIINAGEKVGLVGPNGAGKTTLFRSLTNMEQPDSGDITLASKCSLGYLEQIPDYPEGTSLLDCVLDSFADVFHMREHLHRLEKEMGEKSQRDLERLLERYSQLTHEYEEAGGFSCEAMARKITKGLGFSDDDLNRDINTFSGGEKTRAGLAKILVREPDLLLLDEPTNHLDLEALEWLETFLKGYRGAVFIISHDRYFLDEVVTRILDLNNQELKSFSGNYSRYLVLKKEEELAQAKAYLKQQKEIEKIEEYILKYKAGIKSKQARGRASQLSRLERVERVQDQSTIRLKAGNIASTGEVVLQALDLGKIYSGITIFSKLSFVMYQGEKVALIGGNGTGKSTILKIIADLLPSDTGQVILGSRVNMGYFDQEHKNLDKRNRVVDELMITYGFNEGEARNKLAQVLFEGDDVFKLIADLSGGEKARLSILKIILDEPNFLVLDEPTNHLDVASQEVVEEFLEEFPGTLFIVSHDRYLLDKVTNRTLELVDGKLSNYLGSYSYYKEKKAQMLRMKEELESKEARNLAKNKVQTQEKPKINKAKLKNEIENIEEEIAALEEDKEVLSSELSDPLTYQNEEKSKKKVEKFQKIERELPILYKKWEEACILLEENK